MKKIFAVAVLLPLLLLTAAGAKSLYWERIDVDIYINQDSSVDVTEKQAYVFTGDYNGGYREIKLSGFDSLSDIRVAEGEVEYQRGNLDKYHFTVTGGRGTKMIKWRSRWPDEPPYDQTPKTFTINYKIHGLITYQKDFDELYWKAIFEERESMVNRATVRLHFPAPVDPDKLKINLYTAAQGSVWKVFDDRTIYFAGSELYPNQQFEIKVDFPPGLVKKVFSIKRFFRENITPYLAFLVAGLTLLVMSFLYIRLGRDYEIKGVPRAVNVPPSDLAPALAGTVIDEETGMKEIVATIIDLARRGHIEITETVEKVWVFTTREFEFKLKKTGAGLADFENRVIKGLFGQPKEGDKVKLSDLRNKFYQKVDDIKEAIYKQTVKLGFFAEDPRFVRTKYFLIAALMIMVGLGLTLLISWEVAIMLFFLIVFVGLPVFLMISFLAQRMLFPAFFVSLFVLFGLVSIVPVIIDIIVTSDSVLLLPLGAGLMMGAGVVAAFAPQMPRKPLLGSTAKAQWLAFKR
ncbi:MAG: DUF2207 domain-containing protein, partial [Candidatus Margulisbacteria bacterium]|nr:DUF2207 domain-containing protein [Candidatus Margulisiibacteriota bacterium]